MSISVSYAFLHWPAPPPTTLSSATDALFPSVRILLFYYFPVKPSLRPSSPVLTHLRLLQHLPLSRVKQKKNKPVVGFLTWHLDLATIVYVRVSSDSSYPHTDDC